MDYRALLKKYIEHVGNSEGITFIPATKKQAEEYGWRHRPGPFTDEEIQALQELEED